MHINTNMICLLLCNIIMCWWIYKNWISQQHMQHIEDSWKKNSLRRTMINCSVHLYLRRGAAWLSSRLHFALVLFLGVILGRKKKNQEHILLTSKWLVSSSWAAFLWILSRTEIRAWTLILFPEKPWWSNLGSQIVITERVVFRGTQALFFFLTHTHTHVGIWQTQY